MFNLGAGEVLVIGLLALIVLGPQRLPDAAKQVGRFMGEIRKLSTGFQQELKSAFDEESESTARRKGAAVARPEPNGATPGVDAAGDVDSADVDADEHASDDEPSDVAASDVAASDVTATDGDGGGADPPRHEAPGSAPGPTG